MKKHGKIVFMCLGILLLVVAAYLSYNKPKVDAV